VTNVCGYLTEKRGGGDPDLEEAVEIDGEAQGSEGPTMTGYAPYPPRASGGATEVVPT
jgi:hypothetical protein